MSWTRVFTSGFELNTSEEYDVLATNGSGTPNPSTTKAHTGTYSLRHITNSLPAGHTFKDGTKSLVRCACYINHNGVAAVTGKAIIFSVRQTSAFTGVVWNASTNEIEIILADSVVATVDAVSSGFSATDTWKHIGLIFYNDSSSGFISFYLEGEKILTYTGNTNIGNAVGCYTGGRLTTTSTWNSSAYFDDFLVDHGSGEADECPPSFKYYWAITNANGTFNEWTASGAASNYQAVDDPAANDGDTTHVYAESSGLKEYYGLNIPTLPAGYTINGVVVTIMGKRTNAGIASDIAPYIYEDGVGSSFVAQITPTTAYKPVQGYFLKDVSNAVWTAAKLADTEFGFQSAGTF